MSLQIPHPGGGLHLFRHLLREVTYLPPLARKWTAERIKYRYRHYQKVNKQVAEVQEQRAHHDLRFLRSANNGHVQRLLKICYFATGRLGPRRRNMIKPALGRRKWKSVAHSSEELAHSSWLKLSTPRREPSQNSDNREEKDWLDDWDMEACEALAVSQYSHQTAGSVLQLERLWHPEDKMKRLDAYGKPLSPLRERIRLRNRWAKLFPHLLVPLPEPEWNNLRDLATGEGRPENYNLPLRRPVARSLVQDDTQKEAFSAGRGVSWSDLVAKPMRSIQKGTARDRLSLSGRHDMVQDIRGAGRPTGMRVMTKDKLCHFIYRPCWENSPLMTRDDATGKFEITWGRVQSSLSQPHEKELRHFQGVDEYGGSPSIASKSEKKGKKGRREQTRTLDARTVEESAPINAEDPFAF